MQRSSEATRLWLPQHWPMWVALGLFRLSVLLTWEERRRLSRILGWLVFGVIRVRRRVVLTNLRLCFPEKSPAEILRLAREHYDSLALGLFETCIAWWTSQRDLPPHRIIGGENLQAAIAKGKGAIVLTAHFTTLEICGRLMCEHFALGCLYRDPNNPVIAHFMRLQRERKMSIAVHFDDLKGLVRALRDGHAIWYAPDQAKRIRQSEILPFFGEPAVTTTATPKLAALSSAAVVPYFARREDDGSYTLTILPALENFPSSDVNADAIRINQLMEEHIRRAPAQYFWVHKRFKARGPEYPDAYAS